MNTHAKQLLVPSHFNYSDYFCVDFLFCCIIKQFVHSLEQDICCNKTSFHPTNSWSSSGLRKTEIQCLIYDLRGSMHIVRQGCSLSMFHRTCEKLHGDVRLGGLSMPSKSPTTSIVLRILLNRPTR